MNVEQLREFVNHLSPDYDKFEVVMRDLEPSTDDKTFSATDRPFNAIAIDPENESMCMYDEASTILIDAYGKDNVENLG